MLKIKSKINEIPSSEMLKLNHDLTCYVCCLVETLISKKLEVDKKAMALEILHDQFQLSTDEVDQVSKQIDFLASLGVIKKIPLLKRVASSVGNFFLKRLGN
jgi:hypothetical protein